jgi:hypothetical protein
MSDPIAQADYEDDWTPPPWGFGHASGLDQDAAERDVIADLHAVVEEITGKPVERCKPRIGFLP